jgi:hypothetical protein
MKKFAIALLMLCALLISASAQKKIKPWTEWNAKDAQKILDESAWGQVQTETNTSEMFYSPTTENPGASRSSQGAFNRSVGINFRIRFLTAKPIRQAFKVLIEAQQKPPNQQLSDNLQRFVDQTVGDQIIVGVTFDSDDGRLSGPAMQVFNGATAAELKNTTYLEVKGGKRLFLEDYKAPSRDGMGAKFVFKRLVDGKPFVTPESGELRFYSEMTQTQNRVKLNMRYKVADMMYNGQLEY